MIAPSIGSSHPPIEPESVFVMLALAPNLGKPRVNSSVPLLSV